MDLLKTGNLMKTLRREQGMTQKEVADFMGISQSYISRIEKKVMDRLKVMLSDAI